MQEGSVLHYNVFNQSPCSKQYKFLNRYMIVRMARTVVAVDRLTINMNHCWNMYCYQLFKVKMRAACAKSTIKANPTNSFISIIQVR